MTVKQLKKGDFFTRKPIEAPTEKQVYIRGDYDRETKKYSCIRFDDCNKEIMVKGDTEIFIDFVF